MIDKVSTKVHNTNSYRPNSKDIKGKVLINNMNQTNNLQNDQISKLLDKMIRDITKAELISVKIVRGEKGTKEEMEFLKNNYPNIDTEVKQTIKNMSELKKEILSCSTSNEREKILTRENSKIETMKKEGTLCKVTTKIKEVSLEDVKRFITQIKKDYIKAESILSKLVKGKDISTEEKSFIENKYPKLKNIADALIKEIKILKHEVKNSSNKDQLQEILSKHKINIDSLDKRYIITEKIDKDIDIKPNIRKAINIDTKQLKNIQNILKSELNLDINEIRDIKLASIIEEIESRNSITNKDIQIIKEAIKSYRNKDVDIKVLNKIIKEVVIIEELANTKISKIEYTKFDNLIDEIINNEELSSIYYKLKEIALEEMEEEVHKYENHLLNLNMGIYFYLYNIFSKPLNISIIVVIVGLIILFS